MTHNPANVCVHHKNTRRHAAGKVSLNQRSVVKDPRTHSETGNKAKLTRHRFIHHFELDSSAHLRPVWALGGELRFSLYYRSTGSYLKCQELCTGKPCLLGLLPLRSAESAGFEDVRKRSCAPALQRSAIIFCTHPLGRCNQHGMGEGIPLPSFQIGLLASYGDAVRL